MKRLSIILLFMLFSIALVAQQAIEVYSNQTLKIYSEYWQDSVNFDVAIPDSWHFTDENRSYPLLILFDQQNRTNFDYHLAGINLLTGAGTQIPEIVVAGSL